MPSQKFGPLAKQLRFELWKLRDRIYNHVRGNTYRQEIFTRIYSGGGWAGESASGPGSSLENTEVLRRELPSLWRRYGIRTLVDAPCGDFFWMRHIAQELKGYLGVDIVEKMIEHNQKRFTSSGISFLCADLTSAILPQADAILCRDCFIHLSTRQIYQALRNFKASGARYLLASSGHSIDAYHDIPVGSVRRVNLMRPPFSFPAPLETIKENPATGRYLCLWELKSLPSIR